jgi:hypothetical protein
MTALAFVLDCSGQVASEAGHAIESIQLLLCKFSIFQLDQDVLNNEPPHRGARSTSAGGRDHHRQ